MALGLTPEQIIKKKTHPLLAIDEDWERIELEEIAEVQNGYAFSSKNFNHTEGLPLIRIRDIFHKTTENLYKGKYPKEFVVERADMLIGMDGDFKVARWQGEKALLNQRVCRVKFFSSNYDERFMFYSLQPFLDAIHSETSAVTVKHLSSKTIKAIPLPLPPRPIQRAIVSKLEELFSSLESGIADLKKTQEQLKVYRQAVLKKAFEGGYFSCEISSRPLSSLSLLITKGASPKWQGFDYVEDNEELLFVTSENVREGFISLKKEKYLPKGFNDIQKRSILEKGDVLFNIVGASIGRAAIFKLNKLANINQAVALIRLNGELNSEYLNYFLNSEIAKQEYLKNQVDVARANLSLKNVNDISVPYCKPEEQKKILREIESRLSVCTKIEESLEEGIGKSEVLRQSILKKAFEGKLLTQEEIEKCKKEQDYEPAELLLKRIKAKKRKK